MRSLRYPYVALPVAALVGAGGALTVHHVVRADGIPTATPLIYRGYLEDGGAPMSGPRMIGASLFSAERDGMELCPTATREVTVTAGRFEVALDDRCVAAVRNNRDAWLQLTVGSTVMPRTKLGAVPYAVEADRASGAAGALQTQLAAMQTQLTALQARVAEAEARTSVDCPPGYTRETMVGGFEDAAGNLRRLCRKTLPDGSVDEVVRVGTPPSVFWVDRYEASVISATAPYARAFERDAEPAELPRNGAWQVEQSRTAMPLAAPYLARSVRGVPPARWVTWFQAVELCRMAGKRLPTGEEWLSAAMGTYDPGDHNGTPPDTGCNTGNGAGGPSPTAPRNAGNGAECRSHWYAEDMIGNLGEWTAEWYAGVGNGGSPPGSFIDVDVSPWPAAYAGDRTWNVNSYVADGTSQVLGMPAAAYRGGGWSVGTRSGVYTLVLSNGPTAWFAVVGFRCVLRR
ncbi:MAG: SUMF1/EgtB/PvdO family nonheme iron enzyme [Polyangiales bacterium]